MLLTNSTDVPICFSTSAIYVTGTIFNLVRLITRIIQDERKTDTQFI